MCKLSLIVPIYNVEKYLEKCINSILNQTFSDFELILVNDGSPDNCKSICEKYEKIDKRIKVVNKENGGLSSARNAGLDIAKGEYIGFIDSDDWIHVDMYKKLIEIAEKNSADIVQCDYIDAYDDDTTITNKDTYNWKVIDKFEAIKMLVEFGREHVVGVVSWNKVYRRSLFDSIRFPVGRLNEDEFTTYKLLYKSNKIVFGDEKLYFYRQTPNSIMNKKFNEKRLDILDAIKEQVIFFKTNNYEELYELSLLRYETYLIQFYFKCQDLIADKKILDKVNQPYKNYFKQFINNGKISKMHKLNDCIFYVSPNIYRKIKLLRKKSLY